MPPRHTREGSFGLAPMSLALTNFLVVFDGMVVTVSLPEIQQGLNLSSLDAQWIITAYTLPLGGLLLLGGRLGDRYDRRHLLATGMLLLTTGLLISGTATNAPMMLASRALQGTGAALAVPNTFALISAMPSARKRNRAFAASGIAGSSGSACGAVIGALVQQEFGWRYVFLLSAPFAVFAALSALSLPEATRPAGPPRRLDAKAAALSTGGLALLVYGITTVEQPGSPAWVTAAAVASAAACFTAFVMGERRSESPLLSPTLLKLPSLRAAMASMPGQVFGYNGTVFIALLFFQDARGYSPVEAGLAFTPVGIAAVVGSPVATHLLNRTWSRWKVAAAALALCATGLALLAVSARHGAYTAQLLPGLLLVGFGIAVAAVTLNAAAGENVSDGEKGSAYGLFETSTHVTSTLAVVILATTIAIGSSPSHGHSGNSATGYQLAFAIAAAAAAVGGLAALVLGRSATTAPTHTCATANEAASHRDHSDQPL